jgi:hypothetical protein
VLYCCSSILSHSCHHGLQQRYNVTGYAQTDSIRVSRRPPGTHQLLFDSTDASLAAVTAGTWWHGQCAAPAPALKLQCLLAVEPASINWTVQLDLGQAEACSATIFSIGLSYNKINVMLHTCPLQVEQIHPGSQLGWFPLPTDPDQRTHAVLFSGVRRACQAAACGSAAHGVEDILKVRSQCCCAYATCTHAILTWMPSSIDFVAL